MKVVIIFEFLIVYHLHIFIKLLYSFISFKNGWSISHVLQLEKEPRQTRCFTHTSFGSLFKCFIQFAPTEHTDVRMSENVIHVHNSN